MLSTCTVLSWHHRQADDGERGGDVQTGDERWKEEEEEAPGAGRRLLVLGRRGGGELALEVLDLAAIFESTLVGLANGGLVLAVFRLRLGDLGVGPLDLLGQFSLEQFFNAFAASFLNEANVVKGVGKGSFLVFRNLGRVDRHDCCGRG